MSTLRKISQGLFLALFLGLFVLTQSTGHDTLGYPVRIFLDFDPLVLITTLLAAHAVPRALLLALFLVAATTVLGRVFCGWICPLGTLHTLAGMYARPGRRLVPPTFYRLKYLLLIAILAGALFRLQAAGFLDPLAFLIRSLAVAVYPLFNRVAAALSEGLLNVPGWGDLAAPAVVRLRGTVLAFQPPYFFQAVFVGVILLGLLLANRLERRFWCRYLCPLGALLGLLARFAPLNIRVSEGCTQCGRCAAHCPADAIVDNGRGRRASECLACFACDDPCPMRAVGYGRGAPTTPIDLGRRGVLTSVAAGACVVPLLRISPPLSQPLLIRPPGARPEPEFLQRCIKCGECLKVCITNGLQPTLLEAGLTGIWTPRLVPRVGYCEYNCTLCGQVCPTGAIQTLDRASKVRIKIGLAMLDKNRCLPHAHASPCIACQEVCPTPQKAVWLEDAIVHDRDGREIALKQPHVDLDLCIGCGICEKTCPVADRPAIYVTSIGETRAPENQL